MTHLILGKKYYIICLYFLSRKQEMKNHAPRTMLRCIFPLHILVVVSELLGGWHVIR